MREVKFYKKSYPIIGSGNCVIIFKDELNNDVFYTLASYLGAVASKRIPEISDTSKLMYAFIKTANPTLFPSYKSFMESAKGLAPFVNWDNIMILTDEVNDLLDDGSEEEKKEEEEPKKNQSE